MTFEDDRYLVLKERNKMSIFFYHVYLINNFILCKHAFKVELKNFEEIARAILFMWQRSIYNGSVTIVV